MDRYRGTELEECFDRVELDALSDIMLGTARKHT
jgi:hypothetical protein